MGKLNGWQRLWVLFSLILAIPAVWLVVILWPSEESLYHRWRFDALEQTRQLVQEKENRSLIYSEILPDAKTNLEAVEILRKYGKKSTTGENEGQKIYIELVRNINSKYEKELNGLPSERLSLALQSLSVWAGICGGFYIFGWLIAWVRHGFRKQPE